MIKKMLLNAFNMNCIAHQSNGLWRHPRDESRQYNQLGHWQSLAQTLERGLFDGIFLADVTGVYDVYRNSPDPAIRTGMQIPANDPFSIVPVMAAATEHLTFGVTGTIPYEPPYAFARRMSTLDHLTNGRLAWNVVTGYLDSAARSTGQAQQVDHDTRYDIAADYMELMYKLWEGSWQDDAVVNDKAGGIFADPNKVHAISHQGPYFQMDAIHLCEPSPQRSPVIFQAGSSDKGQDFAAKHAECVFIGATNPKQTAEAVKTLRRRAIAVGRAPSDLKIFAIMATVVDDTDAAAAEKLKDYQSYGLTEGALALMSGWTGIDLAQFDPDDRASNVQSQGIQSIAKAMGSKTVREWGDYMTVAGGSRVLAGSPTTVATQLQEWMELTDLDGFNLAYTVLPECFEDFVDRVVPELQSRGVYKTEYAEGTMRQKLFGKGDRLGNPHPAVAFRAPIA